MPLVPFLSFKGAPGVTTAATAVAGTWPAARGQVVLVECDAAGGDIAARFDLPLEPGLISLTVALDREVDVSAATVDRLLHTHSQELPGGLRCVVAPSAREEMRVPLDRLAEDLPRADGDVIADCGRIGAVSGDEATAVMRLLQRAAMCVVVARPVLSELRHVDSELSLLLSLHVRPLLLLSQGGPYPANEVSRTLRVPVIGALPSDSKGAGLVGGSLLGAPHRWLPLLRAARSVAAALAEELAPPVPDAADAAAPAHLATVPGGAA